MEKPSNGSGHDSGGPEAAGHSRPNGDVFDIAARVGPIPSHVYAIVYPASELRGHRLDALVRWSADVGTCVPSDFKLHAISPSDLAIPMLRRQRAVLAARPFWHWALHSVNYGGWSPHAAMELFGCAAHAQRRCWIYTVSNYDASLRRLLPRPNVGQLSDQFWTKLGLGLDQ